MNSNGKIIHILSLLETICEIPRIDILYITVNTVNGSDPKFISNINISLSQDSSDIVHWRTAKDENVRDFMQGFEADLSYTNLTPDYVKSMLNAYSDDQRTTDKNERCESKQKKSSRDLVTKVDYEEIARKKAKEPLTKDYEINMVRLNFLLSFNYCLIVYNIHTFYYLVTINS